MSDKKTIKTFFGNKVEYTTMNVKHREYQVSFINKLKFLFSNKLVAAITTVYCNDEKIVSTVPSIYIGTQTEIRNHCCKLI